MKSKDNIDFILFSLAYILVLGIPAGIVTGIVVLILWLVGVV